MGPGAGRDDRKKIEIPRGKRARKPREKRGGSMKKARSTQKTTRSTMQKVAGYVDAKCARTRCAKWSAITAVWSALTPPKWTTGSNGHVLDPVAPKTAVMISQLSTVLRATKNACGPYNLVERKERISLGSRILRVTKKLIVTRRIWRKKK
jgi:hypothetical protein